MSTIQSDKRRWESHGNDNGREVTLKAIIETSKRLHEIEREMVETPDIQLISEEVSEQIKKSGLLPYGNSEGLPETILGIQVKVVKKELLESADSDGTYDACLITKPRVRSIWE